MSTSATTPWPACTIAEATARLTAPGAPFETRTEMVRGRETRLWAKAPPTLRHVLEGGRRHGDKAFLVYEDEPPVSFDAFHRATAVLAQTFVDLGIEKGDRVALAMRNLPEWPVVFFAAAAVGAIVTPLNAWWSPEELTHGLEDSGARIAVIDDERLERLTPVLDRLDQVQRIIVARGAPSPAADGRIIALESLIGTPPSWASLPDLNLPAVDILPDGPATLFYTSGTTGRPKGALGTHRNITSNVMSGAFSMARSALRRGQTPPSPAAASPQRCTLLSIPLFHVTGCAGVLIPSLLGGGRLVMMRRWDVQRAYQLIEREKVTVAGGVPTIAWQLIEHPDREHHDLSSLQTIAYGGAASAPELAARIRALFPASQPSSAWGMTETSAVLTHQAAEDYERRPDSCGPAVAVCDLRVCDPEGAPLPPGSVGELWARGPNVVIGYWNNPEATAETFVDGWVRTGDIGRLDEEGFCYILDRAKDMIIRGGENIYCQEVENALYAHPAVMDAAVVGRPHRTLGEEPVAMVTVTKDAVVTEAELQAFVRARLAAFKTPVHIAVSAELLPRNENGKILKNRVKALLNA